MTKKELLTRYRTAVIELDELRRQLRRVGTDGRPGGVRTVRLDGVRGTNDPEAAAMQLAEGLEDLLQEKEAELAQLSGEVDALLRGIRDFRTYMVVQHYYVLAKTDEQVARAMSVSRCRANQLRREFIESA